MSRLYVGPLEGVVNAAPLSKQGLKQNVSDYRLTDIALNPVPF